MHNLHEKNFFVCSCLWRFTLSIEERHRVPGRSDILSTSQFEEFAATSMQGSVAQHSTRTEQPMRKNKIVKAKAKEHADRQASTDLFDCAIYFQPPQPSLVSPLPTGPSFNTAFHTTGSSSTKWKRGKTLGKSSLKNRVPQRVAYPEERLPTGAPKEEFGRMIFRKKSSLGGPY